MDCGDKAGSGETCGRPLPGVMMVACRRQLGEDASAAGVSGKRERIGELNIRSRGLDAEGLHHALAGSSKAAFLCEKS